MPGPFRELLYSEINVMESTTLLNIKLYVEKSGKTLRIIIEFPLPMRAAMVCVDDDIRPQLRSYD